MPPCDTRQCQRPHLAATTKRTAWESTCRACRRNRANRAVRFSVLARSLLAPRAQNDSRGLGCARRVCAGDAARVVWRVTGDTAAASTLRGAGVVAAPAALAGGELPKSSLDPPLVLRSPSRARAAWVRAAGLAAPDPAPAPVPAPAASAVSCDARLAAWWVWVVERSTLWDRTNAARSMRTASSRALSC